MAAVHALSDQMMELWINFAYNGTPNGKADEEVWPAYGRKGNQGGEFGVAGEGAGGVGGGRGYVEVGGEGVVDQMGEEEACLGCILVVGVGGGMGVGELKVGNADCWKSGWNKHWKLKVARMVEVSSNTYIPSTPLSSDPYRFWVVSFSCCSKVSMVSVSLFVSGGPQLALMLVRGNWHFWSLCQENVYWHSNEPTCNVNNVVHHIRKACLT
jgi:hypothetical protein